MFSTVNNHNKHEKWVNLDDILTCKKAIEIGRNYEPNEVGLQGRSQDFSKGEGVTLWQTLSSWRFRHGIL